MIIGIVPHFYCVIYEKFFYWRQFPKIHVLFKRALIWEPFHRPRSGTQRDVPPRRQRLRPLPHPRTHPRLCAMRIHINDIPFPKFVDNTMTSTGMSD
jgi:hypothetical protein